MAVSIMIEPAFLHKVFIHKHFLDSLVWITALVVFESFTIPGTDTFWYS